MILFQFWMLDCLKIESLKDFNQIDSLMPILGFTIMKDDLNFIHLAHLSELRCSLMLKIDVNFTWRDVEILRRAFCLHTLLFLLSAWRMWWRKLDLLGKTYLGFYNLFVVCLGQFILLSVLRRLSNTFLCLFWNICTLLGLIRNLFQLFCHFSKQLITNYNFSKPIRPLKILIKSN